MFGRLPHFLVISLVFASMWIQGMVPAGHDDQGMMESSCLEHCLASFHLGTVDDGGVISVAIANTAHQFSDDFSQFIQSESIRMTRGSHDDPKRILTTIKRE